MIEERTRITQQPDQIELNDHEAAQEGADESSQLHRRWPRLRATKRHVPHAVLPLSS